MKKYKDVVVVVFPKHNLGTKKTTRLGMLVLRRNMF